jgi:hypothetical protein
MHNLDELKRQARLTTSLHGHLLGAFETVSPSCLKAKCVRCKFTASVSTFKGAKYHGDPNCGGQIAQAQVLRHSIELKLGR